MKWPFGWQNSQRLKSRRRYEEGIDAVNAWADAERKKKGGHDKIAALTKKVEQLTAAVGGSSTPSTASGSSAGSIPKNLQNIIAALGKGGSKGLQQALLGGSRVVGRAGGPRAKARAAKQVAQVRAREPTPATRGLNNVHAAGARTYRDYPKKIVETCGREAE